MAKYELNERAVARARDLISVRQYVVKSTWGDVQPLADDENGFWRAIRGTVRAVALGVTAGAPDQTKARYGFVYGDLRWLHRSGFYRVPIPRRRVGL